MEEWHFGNFHFKIESLCYGRSSFLLKLFTDFGSCIYSFVKIPLLIYKKRFSTWSVHVLLLENIRFSSSWVFKSFWFMMYIKKIGKLRTVGPIYVYDGAYL